MFAFHILALYALRGNIVPQSFNHRVVEMSLGSLFLPTYSVPLSLNTSHKCLGTSYMILFEHPAVKVFIPVFSLQAFFSM